MPNHVLGTNVASALALIAAESVSLDDVLIEKSTGLRYCMDYGQYLALFRQPVAAN